MRVPALLLTGFVLLGQESPRRPPQPPESGRFLTQVPEHPGSVVLVRPNARSIALSLLWHADAEALLVWDREGTPLPKTGRKLSLKAGVPILEVLEGLEPDTAYTYALLHPGTGRRMLPTEAPGRFHTARPRGASFSFTVTADSHLDGACSLERYARTLAVIGEAAPDFHIDLGDTFMTEKHPDRDSAADQYRAQRYWFGTMAHSIPLFLVLGNHDGEGPDRKGQIPPEGLGLWSFAQRTRFFPAPAADAFYSAPATRFQDACAWTWGDALFVLLDPYWTSTPTRGGREPWNTTLGKAQYDWLARTLRDSSARYKFIFIHQLTGSDHPAGRGGAEASAFQEWGGRELDGRETFAEHRPDWEKPVHALLVETGVSAVFHGHDHFYARQERDGITYQLVPQPAHRGDRAPRPDEYGYREGEFLPSSGHLRVKVTPDRATIDYVRGALPEQEQRGTRNGAIAASYSLFPKSARTPDSAARP